MAAFGRRELTETVKPATVDVGSASAPGGRGLGLAGDETFALRAFARQLAGAADGLHLLAYFLFRRLLVVSVALHLAEDAFALHFPLQRLESLVDIVVANEDLHASFLLADIPRIALMPIVRVRFLGSRRKDDRQRRLPD